MSHLEVKSETMALDFYIITLSPECHIIDISHTYSLNTDPVYHITDISPTDSLKTEP